MKVTNLIIVLILVSPVLTSCTYLNRLTGNSKVYNCEEPLTYRIGTIDDRFEVSREHVEKALEEAYSTWSGAVDKSLGEYSEDGEVTINLIYDERQELAEEAHNYRITLAKNKQQIDRLKFFYYRRDQRYTEQKAAYNKLRESYRQKLADFNRRMEELHLKENLSEENLNEISTRQAALDFDKEVLEDKQKELKTLRKRIDENKEELTALINENNRLTEEYNRKFTGRESKAQGTFKASGNKKSINIYRFLDLVELRVVLAHEMGHAMGLKHVSDSGAIMYYKTVNESSTLLRLTEQDKQAITEVCGIEYNP